MINKNKLINMFEDFNINNKQNKRYIIIGNSGTQKTQLGFYLLLKEFNNILRIKFILGGKSVIFEKFKSLLIDNNIVVEEYIINNINDLNDLLKDNNNKLYDLRKNDLIFIDDITHLMKNNIKFEIFLNKIFTTSRQKNYDIILILHKFKLFNKVIRNNATKMFFNSIDKELKEEFDDIILNYNLFPIVIDNINKKQVELIIDDDFNFEKELSNKKLSFNQLNGEGLLKFIRKVNNNYKSHNNNNFHTKKDKSTREVELERELIDKANILNYKYDEIINYKANQIKTKLDNI